MREFVAACADLTVHTNTCVFAVDPHLIRPPPSLSSIFYSNTRDRFHREAGWCDRWPVVLPALSQFAGFALEHPHPWLQDLHSPAGKRQPVVGSVRSPFIARPGDILARWIHTAIHRRIKTNPPQPMVAALAASQRLSREYIEITLSYLRMIDPSMRSAQHDPLADRFRKACDHAVTVYSSGCVTPSLRSSGGSQLLRKLLLPGICWRYSNCPPISL